MFSVAGNVDDDNGNDGGNAGSIVFDFWSNLQNFGATFGRAEHNLDPSRVEYIHKRSIFRLDTTTN